MILYTSEKYGVVSWISPGERFLLSERYWARKRDEFWPMRLYRPEQECIGVLDDENRPIIHKGVQVKNGEVVTVG